MQIQLTFCSSYNRELSCQYEEYNMIMNCPPKSLILCFDMVCLPVSNLLWKDLFIDSFLFFDLAISFTPVRMNTELYERNQTIEKRERKIVWALSYGDYPLLFKQY